MCSLRRNGSIKSGSPLKEHPSGKVHALWNRRSEGESACHCPLILTIDHHDTWWSDPFCTLTINMESGGINNHHPQREEKGKSTPPAGDSINHRSPDSAGIWEAASCLSLRKWPQGSDCNNSRGAVEMRWMCVFNGRMKVKYLHGVERRKPQINWITRRWGRSRQLCVESWQSPWPYDK